MTTVKILISCDGSDQSVQVEQSCTFNEFRKKVHRVFPFLPKNFSISDSDFVEITKDTFEEIKQSRVETWCMVRRTREDACKLDKPRYELLRYDVHPNALTQSGDYHFSSSYQAFCEFFDNSIQATSNNHTKNYPRTIKLHVFLKEKVAAIFDNGEGMSYDGLKAFATYFLSQADRGLEKTELDQIPAYLDGFISKFGVGATQAGFYLGDKIKVVTKKDDCPYVTEITISKEKLHKRADEGKPVFEDYRCIRNPGDFSTLETVEEQKCLKELVEDEQNHKQFTCVVITGIKDKHIDYMKKDEGHKLTRNLAHVYHFYLWGEHGSSGNMRLSLKSRSVMDLANFKKVDMQVLMSGHRKECVKLADISDDLESLYQNLAKDWFSFTLTLKVPGLNLPQTVQGVLMYYPHESGQETIPCTTDDGEDSEPMFECFWQGRLAPLSYVHRLSFCSPPSQRTKKQKDILPDICYRRLKGILFFNRHTPISNNKLKILLDERKNLSSALEDATAERRLPQEFRSWLEKCHRELDKEVSFEDLVPSQPRGVGGDVFYKTIRVITNNGEQTYTQGDILKLDTRPFIYGRVLYFIQTNKKNDMDKVVVVRQPEEVYQNQQEEKPISRIIEIPDPLTIKKLFNAEKLILPKTLKILRDPHQGDEVSTKLTWLAGETRKDQTGLWIKVFNGERPPKPLVAVHSKKLTIRQVVDGPERVAPIQNDSPIDGERYGFKPFWLGKAGCYELRYVAMLGDRDMCSAKIDIEVKANVGTFVRIDEPAENVVPLLSLGDASLKFKLHFQDKWANPTSLFPGGDTIRLEVTSSNLEIHGVKNSYKANRDGNVEVSGLTIETKNNGKFQSGREHSIRVTAVNIGYVKFPIRLQAGPPHTIKLPSFETTQVRNYEEFPEFTVSVFDKWDQFCFSSDRKIKLHAECDAFTGGPYLSAIEQGQASLGPMKIKVRSGQTPCIMKVKISLVNVDVIRRKQIIKDTLKELIHFTINVLPSGLPHRIQICHKENDSNCTSLNGNSGHSRDCLELSAPAGSIIKGLYLSAFDESGRCLTVAELKGAEPRIQTSWNGEVSFRNLPALPDCPVAQLVASTFLGNVTCTCNDVISCQTQIRIRPEEGEPKKWIFISKGSFAIDCDVKRQLPSKLCIQVRDKFGNPTECPPDIAPQISLAYTKQNSGQASFHGYTVYHAPSREFRFSNDALISGAPGTLTMIVSDEHGKFSKDTQNITLKPGPPHHIEIWSQAFETTDLNQTQKLRAVSGCCQTSSIQACVCDRTGNKTPLKTTFNLNWAPVTSGNSVSKKTNSKGEAVFVANAIQCTAKPDQQVNMKISSTEHKGIQPAVVHVSVESSNRVTGLIVTKDQNQLFATSLFPALKIECKTEDGVRVDVVDHITLGLTMPDGNIIPGSTVYHSPTQNKEGILSFTPLADKLLEIAGNWSITCQFTEYRENLKSILVRTEHVTFSSPLKFNVLPGPAKSLVVKYQTDNAGLLTASSTADSRGRTILPRAGKNETVEIFVLDQHGNTADISIIVDVNIISQPAVDANQNYVMPVLEDHPVKITVDRGKSRVPRLILKSRVGDQIGEYLLVFTAQKLEPCLIKFAFSTDEHMQRLQSKLEPLKKQVKDKEHETVEAKRQHSKLKLEVNSKLAPIRNLVRASEPRSCEVMALINRTKQRLTAIDGEEKNVRKPIIPRHYPPDRIRQYIKGVVAELAYVSDPDVARLLSWYLQSKMGVSLTTAIDKQRKVYDLGYSAYCESTLLPFSKKGFDGRDGRALPLEFPRPPDNFRSSIQFAINLLEFSSNYGYLRSTLYWSLLSKTMVIENLESAQIYRQHLVKMRCPCPTILTRDGNVIASDGLMDPKRRCPRSLSELKFAFGSLPPTELPENKELQVTLNRLVDLNTSVEEYEKSMDVVRRKEEELKEQKVLLSPQITNLERELRKLRAPPSQREDYDSPQDKRIRR